VSPEPGAADGRVEVPPDERDLAGTFRHRRELEIRFGDTDAMGHVNNAVYLTYCEQARASYWLVATGQPLPLGVHGEEGLILAETRITFRSPAFFGETLTVETRVTRIGRSSFDQEHRITAPDSRFGPARLVAITQAVLVTYDYAENSVRPLPDDLIRRLEWFEGRRLRP
jgi:acyl-CoA thioester hydrolase